MVIAYLGNVALGDGYPVRIIGVVNLSPESFYQGSVAHSVEEAVERAASLVEEGADIIDVGAMSTAPYKNAWIPPEEEERRLIPVVKRLAETLTVPISVDTYRPGVAVKALEAGASIINDVTGLGLYPELANVAARYGASMILCARLRKPNRGDPVENLLEAASESLAIAIRRGVDPVRIALDPCIGFPILPPRDEPLVASGPYRHGDEKWSWVDWDLYVLSNLSRFKSLNRPVVIGVSRKSFLRRLAGVESPDEILPASVSAESLAVFLGANGVRTHNPRDTRQAVRIAESLARWFRYSWAKRLA